MGKPLGSLGQLLIQALAVEETKRQLPRVDEPVPTRLAQLLHALENAEENDTALKWDVSILESPEKANVRH